MGQVRGIGYGYAHMYVYMCICVCMCLCVCEYVCVCVSLCHCVTVSLCHCVTVSYFSAKVLIILTELWTERWLKMLKMPKIHVEGKAWLRGPK
jgi:hypothetical protein